MLPRLQEKKNLRVAAKGYKLLRSDTKKNTESDSTHNYTNA